MLHERPLPVGFKLDNIGLWEWWKELGPVVTRPLSLSARTPTPECGRTSHSLIPAMLPDDAPSIKGSRLAQGARMASIEITVDELHPDFFPAYYIPAVLVFLCRDLHIVQASIRFSSLNFPFPRVHLAICAIGQLEPFPWACAD